MANNFGSGRANLAKVFVPILDDVYKHSTLTSVLDGAQELARQGANGNELIVRIPTVSLEDEQRKHMGFGETLNITFEGKVMHFFDPETEKNLLA